MQQITERIKLWIRYSIEKNEYNANILEEDIYKPIVKPIIDNLKSQLNMIYSELIKNYKDSKDLISEVINLIDRIERWEKVIDRLWLEFYELSAKYELERYEEYSIIDGNFEVDERLESNFIRYLLRLSEFDPVKALRILTSPAIEFKGKVLFMPIRYIYQKIKFKYDEKQLEDEIMNAVIEEELHKVVTKLEGEEVSAKLDNVMGKIWLHLRGE